MRRLALACLLTATALVGCSRRDTGDAAVYDLGNDAVTLSPGTQAVRIGESGASFPACTGAGQVVNLSPSGLPDLPVRAAPFDEASAVAHLREGTRVYLCSRSLDQRWQGVVVPPEEAPDSDCGVAAPVESARDYGGPCRAGWVLGTFLQPSAR